MQKETILALFSINIIIHQELSKYTRKNRMFIILKNVHYTEISNVHYTESYKKTLKRNSRNLYEKHLTVEKSEFAVTLSEALINEYETNRQT